jgi:Na+/H+ antiporter NhaD/arsenite permease-like protein
VLASNIGAGTLVGDRPNIIIASRSRLGFNDFLSVMRPFVLVVLCRIMCRRRSGTTPNGSSR